MDKKGNKVVMMPGADQLASQVAKALRDANQSSEKPEKSNSSMGDAKNEDIKAGETASQFFDAASPKPTNSKNTFPKKTNSKPSHDSLLQYLDPRDIEASPFQARSNFSEKELDELAESIESKGLLQPIVVRLQAGGDSYQLIAGERRLRAAQKIGLTEIPAIVQQYSDREALECAIIENAQREDLNPIEEARAFKLLTSEFGLNQTEVAKAVGKNRATVSNSLRLLQLDESVLELLESGELSAGHGRALCSLELDDQLRFARKTLAQNLSVRGLEAAVQKLDEPEVELDEQDEKIQAALKRLENRLVELIGTERLSLKMDDEGRKRLSVCFETDASFKRFISKLKA